MSGQTYASNASAPAIAYGQWLRTQRDAKQHLLRTLAAAADMDPSHLGKVERGERLPTREQAERLAHLLGLELEDMRARFAAAQIWRKWGNDPDTAFRAASLVQEHAAAYRVNKSVHNRRKTSE